MPKSTPAALLLVCSLSACGEPQGPIAPASGAWTLRQVTEVTAPGEVSAEADAGEDGRGAEQRLVALMDGFLTALRDGTSTDAFVHPDFTTCAFHGPLPGEAEEEESYATPLHAAGSLEVRELGRGSWIPEDGAPTRYSAAEAAGSLRELSAKLGGGSLGWEIRVDSLESEEAAVLDLAFFSRGAPRIQVNQRLGVRHQGGRLRSLGPGSRFGHAYLEIRSPAPLFEEVSAAVFGQEPSYEQEALAGIDGLLFRRDILMGGDRYGWHGVAVGDVDGDGRDDLYLPQPAGLPNRLFLHQADGSAKDHTVKSRVGVLEESRAAYFVNLDDDSDQDLVLAIGPGVATAKNRGFGTFDDLVPVRAPGPGDVIGMTVGDADRDGDLDVYAARYSRGDFLDVPLSGDPAEVQAARNALFLNEDGVFREAAVELGLNAGAPGFSRAAIFADLDLDGDLDLHVLNDFGPNVFFQAGEGRVQSTGSVFTRVEESAPGGNAWVPADLQRGNGVELSAVRPHHAEAALRAKAGQPNTWARLLPGRGDPEGVNDLPGFWTDQKVVDLQNRGLLAVVRTQGLLSAPGRFPWDEGYLWEGALRTGNGPLPRWDRLRTGVEDGDALFAGGGPRLSLQGLGFRADATHLSGLGEAADGRAVGVLDWDDDGRQDLVFRSRCAPRWQLFVNRAPAPGNFITVNLTGLGTNRDAVGARVTVRSGDLVRSRHVTVGGSPGQSTRRLHFGVGDQERVERIEILWPDGVEEVLTDLETNKRYDVRRGDKLLRWFNAQPADLGSLPANTFGEEAVAASRVPLAEKLPIGALTYEGFDGEALRVDGLAGAPALFVLLELGDPRSKEVLGELQENRNLVERGALRIVPLVVGASGATARRGVTNYGYMLGAGVANEDFLESLALVIESVVGEVPGVPLPLSFLVDDAGQLTSLYFEPPDLDVLLPDAESVWRMRTKNLAATRLMNGVRLMGRQRDFRGLAERFRELGREDLVTFYDGLRR